MTGSPKVIAEPYGELQGQPDREELPGDTTPADEDLPQCRAQARSCPQVSVILNTIDESGVFQVFS